MPLDSRHLPVFLAVMQLRSIGRAAAKLGMTQPAASRILKKLEDEVGTNLFERHPSGVIPTIHAETLFPYAEEIVSNSRTAVEEIGTLIGQGVSIVRVGAVASIANSLMPSAIDRLLRKWKYLRIQLMEGVEDQLSEALASGEIDIAIAGQMQQHEEVLFSRPDMLSGTLAVIARHTHPLVGVSDIPLSELVHQHWVLPPKSTMAVQEFCRRFRQAGLEPPNITVETRSVSAIRATVASMDILSWQPRAILSLHEYSGGIVELPVSALLWRRLFYVYKRQRGLLAPAARKLVEELREVCRTA
jgi:DNA-binding transcriptional LysR family regulator